MKMQITGYLDEFYNYILFLGAVFYFVFIKKLGICILKCFIWKDIRLSGIESKLKNHMFIPVHVLVLTAVGVDS